MKTVLSERERFLWILLSCAILVIIVLRIAPLNVVVLSDEYTYKNLSYFVPLESAHVPSYAYFIGMLPTRACGAAFYECVKIFNVAFLALGSFFIFLTARLFLPSERIAACIAILSLLLPSGIYAAFFMPETAYFAGFWIVSYLLLDTRHLLLYRKWALIGVALGLLALIKPHGLLLLPAIGVYALAFYIERSAPQRTFPAVAILTGACIATKMSLGYLLAGTSGLTLFGETYGSIASGSSSLSKAAAMLSPAATNLTGHVLGLSLILGLPIAATIAGALDRRNPAFLLSIYALAIGATMVVATAAFTASVSSFGPHESPFRLHMRYYNFAYPLLFIALASADTTRMRSIPALLIGAPLIAAALYIGAEGLSPFTPIFVDSPFLRGLERESLLLAMSAASAILILAWIRRIDSARYISLFVVYPIALVAVWSAIDTEISGRRTNDTYDRAGKIANLILEEDALLYIAADDEIGKFRSAFHANRTVNFDIDTIEHSNSYMFIQKDTNQFGRIIYKDAEIVIMYPERGLASTPVER